MPNGDQAPVTASTSTPSATSPSATSPSASSPSSTSDSTVAALSLITSNKSSSSSTTSTSSAQLTSTALPPTPPTNTNTISQGAAAGIGVGCAVVGAFLASLIIIIFMKRSKRSRGRSHRHFRDVETEKGTSTGNAINLEENLLERADDSHIRRITIDLNEIIDQHVENYYHLQILDGSQGNLEQRLVECGYNTDRSVRETISMLQNSKSRYAGIRQLIATIILQNIDWTAKAEVSLLPPQIAEFCETIPPIEKQQGCEEVFDKAFIKWRHLSAFLLQPMRTSREAPKVNERELQRAIQRNVAIINGVLEPFIKPGVEAKRYQEDSLRAIIFAGAQLGLLLFSQPSVWSFSWTAPRRDETTGVGKGGVRVTTSGRPTVVVVFPSLRERAERQGRQGIKEITASVVVDL